MSADRDPLAVALHARMVASYSGHEEWECRGLADALLPVVQALATEGAAAELRAAADEAWEDSFEIARALRRRADALTAGSEANR